MIEVRLKIGDGDIEDTIYKYGFIYYKADNILVAPVKDFESTSYALEEGENISNETVDAPFDYNVEFFVGASNGLTDANGLINEFNSLLFEKQIDSHIKKFKTVEFYNDYKKVKIVGVPTLIPEPTEYWRDVGGEESAMIVARLKIRVVKPSLCDFNLT